jgi:hypothetical protein
VNTKQNADTIASLGVSRTNVTQRRSNIKEVILVDNGLFLQSSVHCHTNEIRAQLGAEQATWSGSLPSS